MLYQLLLRNTKDVEIADIFFMSDNLEIIYQMIVIYFEDYTETNDTSDKRQKFESYRRNFLLYHITNFFLGDIKKKILESNTQLYISNFQKFSKINTLAVSYYPTNIYQSLIQDLVFLNFDLKKLSDLSCESTSICKI